MALSKRDIARLEEAVKNKNVTRGLLSELAEKDQRLSVRQTLGLPAQEISASRVQSVQASDPFVTTASGQETILPAQVRQQFVPDKNLLKRTLERQPQQQQQSRALAEEQNRLREKIKQNKITEEASKPFEKQRIANELIRARRQAEIKADVNNLLDVISEKEETLSEPEGFLEGIFGTREKDEQELNQAKNLLDEILQPEVKDSTPAGSRFLQALTTSDQPNNEFNNEEEARAAGFQDGDKVIINGVQGTLAPNRRN